MHTMTDFPLCREMRMDDKEIRDRWDFLALSDADQRHLEVIHRLIEEDASAIISEFYEALLRVEPIAEFLAEPHIQARLRDTQRRYLLTLGQEVDKLDYFEDRLRIGVAHERVGLEQKWYLGGYAILFGIIARRLRQRYPSDPETLAGCLVALQKIFTVDATLAVETYYHATMRRLEDSLRQLTETQKSLEELARLDGLTRINNRMHLMTCLEHELQRSQRFRRPFTLLFLDVDHFKAINDAFGHSVGDGVLKEIVQTVRSVIRPVDMIGRFGGEEFLIGLVETDEATGRQVAERIRLKVAHTPFRSNNAHVTVTVSIGLTSLASATERVEELINRADHALYQAKEAGRDQVRICEGAAAT